MLQKIKVLAGEAADLLYPRRCPVCGGIVLPKGALICPACRGFLSYIKEPTCRSCGKEIEDPTAEYCGDCSRRRHSFVRCFGILNYTETESESMSAIKYRNRKEYIDFYASEAVRLRGREIRAIAPDCLIPVPVHPSRLRKRGFNQAGVLAEKIGEILGIPVEEDFLLRLKKTTPQKSLDPGERLRNLMRAFGTAGDAPDWMRRVLLVDDIYTTGSTAEACTRVLLSSGVREVWVFVICVGHGQ